MSAVGGKSERKSDDGKAGTVVSKSVPTVNTTGAPRILSRIYVTEDGEVVVTDLWEALERELIEVRGFERS